MGTPSLPEILEAAADWLREDTITVTAGGQEFTIPYDAEQQVVVSVDGRRQDGDRAINFIIDDRVVGTIPLIIDEEPNGQPIEEVILEANGQESTAETDRKNDQLEDAIVSHLDSMGVDAQEAVESRQSSNLDLQDVTESLASSGVSQTDGTPLVATTASSISTHVNQR